MTLELIHDYDPSDDERSLIAKLAARLEEHARKNKSKWAYYEGKNALKDLNIALPAVASSIRAVVGWPEIVVDSLAERLEWQGWISPKADISELDQVFAENDLASEFAKATLESLVTGMGFLEVSAGGNGEPTIIIDAVTAGEATYMWDDRLNRMAAGYIEKTGENGEKYQTLHLPDRVISIITNPHEAEKETVCVKHGWGRCGLVRIPNRSRAGKDAGASEITTAIEYYTDHGVRTVLGMEFNREYYTTPQRYLLNATFDQLGLEEDATESDLIQMGWKVAMSKALVVPPGDPDDGLPNITAGQFQASPPTPYIEELKMMAQLVSAQSGVPVSYLGFASDNPPSADSIRATESRLVRRTELRQLAFGRPLCRDLAYVCKAILDGRPPEWEFIASLEAKWLAAATPTLSATMDAMTKAVAAEITPKHSSVVWGRVGFSPTEQEIMRKELAEQSATQRATALAGGATTIGDATVLDLARANREPEETPNSANETAAETAPQENTTASRGGADDLKQRADALGVMIRAGVEPTVAADLAGLPGIQFTGATPVSLREKT